MNDLSGKRVVVTGGAGFLGRHVVDAIREFDPREVLVLRSSDCDLREQSEVRRFFSDWAGDVNSRKSTSEYILYLMDAPILWKSKGQTTIALSSAEAEYYALTEAAKEVKFVVQLLTTRRSRRQGGFHVRPGMLESPSSQVSSGFLFRSNQSIP